MLLAENDTVPARVNFLFPFYLEKGYYMAHGELTPLAFVGV